MRSLALLALFALSSTASAQTTPYVAEMRAAIGLLAARISAT